MGLLQDSSWTWMELWARLLMHGEQHAVGPRRTLLALNTSQLAIIVAASLVGALLLAVVVFLACTKCGRAPSDKVHPDQAKDVEHGAQPGAAPFMGHPPGALQPQGLMMAGLEPVPPWEQYGQPPPGIMLSPTIPVAFTPFASNPRPPNAPPYERLVLVSSRVHQPMKVAEAVLPNVAVVVYDWKLFTLQELLSYIKRTLGPGAKVTSLAVVAPGNTPGCVALLEGQTSSAEKLAGGTGELAQFWRVLAGCVAANGVSDGRRVDLLGCRVLEAPQEGAALLKTLWSLTSVPFAAADDALLGYQLATFLEEPHSGALSVIASTIQGIDLYFDRNRLLGIEAPVAGQGAAPAGLLPPLPSSMYTPPMPAGAPPAGALQPLPGAAAAAPASGPAATAVAAGQQQAAAQPAAVPKDIFARFAADVSASGSTPAAVFALYDKDKSGWLSQDEVIHMVAVVVPGTSQLDADHFRCMLDLDGNQQVSQAEFVAALADNAKASVAARAGRDETALMKTLHDYLTDNEAVIRQYFVDADVNQSGTLDHAEVVALVAQIPGLEKDEQKLIASYLYQQDTSSSGQLTFDQLRAAVRAYGTPAATSKVLTPFPAQAAAAAAAAQPVAAAPAAGMGAPAAGAAAMGLPTALAPTSAAVVPGAARLPPAHQVLTPVPLASSAPGGVLAAPGQMLAAPGQVLSPALAPLPAAAAAAPSVPGQITSPSLSPAAAAPAAAGSKPPAGNLAPLAAPAGLVGMAPTMPGPNASVLPAPAATQPPVALPTQPTTAAPPVIAQQAQQPVQGTALPGLASPGPLAQQAASPAPAVLPGAAAVPAVPAAGMAAPAGVGRAGMLGTAAAPPMSAAAPAAPPLPGAAAAAVTPAAQPAAPASAAATAPGPGLAAVAAGAGRAAMPGTAAMLPGPAATVPAAATPAAQPVVPAAAPAPAPVPGLTPAAGNAAPAAGAQGPAGLLAPAALAGGAPAASPGKLAPLGGGAANALPQPLAAGVAAPLNLARSAF